MHLNSPSRRRKLALFVKNQISIHLNTCIYPTYNCCGCLSSKHYKQCKQMLDKL